MRVSMASADEPLGLEFHAIGGRVFVDGCKDSPHPLRVVADPDGAIGAMRGRISGGGGDFPIEVDGSDAAKIWEGAPVEMMVDREWLAGTVRAVNADGTFDVHLTEDDEEETGVSAADLRVRDRQIQGRGGGEAAEEERKRQTRRADGVRAATQRSVWELATIVPLSPRRQQPGATYVVHMPSHHRPTMWWCMTRAIPRAVRPLARRVVGARAAHADVPREEGSGRAGTLIFVPPRRRGSGPAAGAASAGRELGIPGPCPRTSRASSRKGRQPDADTGGGDASRDLS
eukprot:gene6109-43164_t